MKNIITSKTGAVLSLINTLESSLKDLREEQYDKALSKFTSASGLGFIKKDAKISNIRDILQQTNPSMVIIDYARVYSELKKYTTLEFKSKKETIVKDALGREIKDELGNPKITVEVIEPRTQEERVASVFQDRKDIDEILRKLVKAVQLGVVRFIQSSKPEPVSIHKIGNILFENQFFKQSGIFQKPYRILDAKFGQNSDHVFIFQNYNSAYSLLGKRINDSVRDTIKQLKIGKDGKLDSGLLSLLALGHIGVETEDAYLANFPKLTSIFIDRVLNISLKEENMSIPIEVPDVDNIVYNFLVETKQLDQVIKVDKNFTAEETFLKMYYAAGGEALKLENSLFNSLRGSGLESAFEKGAASRALNSLRKYLISLHDSIQDQTQRGVLKAITQKIKVAADGFVKGKGSPSLVDFIETSVISILTGKKVQPFKQSNTKNTTISTKSKTKKPSKKKVSLAFTGKKNTKSLERVVVSGRSLQQATNLSSLLNQINGLLQQQIRRNMGTGNSRDLLNYRTGRFAQSVKVERLSESRQGMITAFYSYMKNPYATFSQGGRQQYPRSRDPKTLISKSIREIAQTMVTNQLRAVNV